MSHRCPSLLLLALVLLPASAGARTLPLDQPVAGPLDRAALRLVRERAAAFGAGRGAVLRVAGVTSLRGGSVVRLAQERDGLPVLGAGVSLLARGQRFVAASGQLRELTAVEAGPILGWRAALPALQRALPASRVREARLAILPRGTVGVPVWELDVARWRPLGIWRVLVEARSGRLLWGLSALQRAQGNAYLPNPMQSAVQQVELQGLIPERTVEEGLVGEYARVASCSRSAGSLNCSRHATRDTEGNYPYQPDEPSTSDPFAEVQAYYHVDTFHRWLAKEHGFSRSGPTQQIDVIVNLTFETSGGDTEGVYNAFFGDLNDDGHGDLVFGQGKWDFAYDGDVIYHEFTHSVVSETSDLSVDLDELGLNMMPGSLNEGFADLWSSIFAGDAVVGEYAGGINGIRTLTGAASCPDGLSGESHQDGLIWGRANWAARAKAADPALYDQILYQTMVGLGQHASIAEAAKLFLTLAQGVAPAVAQVAQVEFQSRGLMECSRIIPLVPLSKRRGYLMGTSALGLGGLMPAAMQYKVEVPAGAQEMRLEVKAPFGGGHWGGGAESIGAFLRQGQPVAFAGLNATRDFTMLNTETEITLAKGNAERPLVPGATYYVIPVNVGSYDTMYEVRVSFVEDPTATPDLGSPTADAPVAALDAGTPATEAGTEDLLGTGRGCACALDAEPDLPALSLLLGLGLVLVLGVGRSRPGRGGGARPR